MQKKQTKKTTTTKKNILKQENKIKVDSFALGLVHQKAEFERPGTMILQFHFLPWP